MAYEINKELVLSTAHIRREDSDILESGVDFIDGFEYGWRLWVGVLEHYPDPGGMEKFRQTTRLSSEVWNLLVLARTLDCRWLVLDCDGPVEKNLPEFDW
jgi:hypothetical protein